MKKSHTLILLFSLLSFTRVTAQTVVEAHLDTADILIGEQVQLSVRVKTDARKRVHFPLFAAESEIVPGVEVIGNGRVDTLLHNAGKRIELQRKYTVTSFDSALYNITPFAIIENDTIRARNSVGLKVSTVKVDTTHVENFRGPHAVVDSPFKWTAHLLWLSLFLLVLTFAVFALAVRLSDKKPITRRIVIPPPIAPHKQAMAEIENIKIMPKNSREQAKEYYMRLTDILRTYIKERFGLNAREMTSQEIIDHLLRQNDPSALHELQEIFETADLVKFAKYESTLNETDRSIMQAIDFVNTTKPDETQQPRPQEKIVTLGDTKQRKLRRGMWGALLVLSLATILLGLYLMGEIIETFF